MDLRLSTAIAASKLSGIAIRRLGRGGGTAVPGIIGNLIDPSLLDKLGRQVPAGCIVVAGTNGKTTTARMLAAILEQAGLVVIHNRTGSNLVRGISAAFAEQSSLAGSPVGDIAVIETDEAAFPEVVRRVSPRLVLLLNLFRDQLDRYGELDTIARRWQETVATLPADCLLLANGDDPALAALTVDAPVQRRYFGIADSRYVLDALPHAADAAVCRRCGAPLAYTQLFLSHLGDYRCPRCGFHRPPLDDAADDIALHDLETIDLRLRHDNLSLPLHIGVPGLYNAYNAVAAAAAALSLGVQPDAVTTALGAFRSAFGRIERVAYDGRHLVIILVKNPVGFNEVLRMLAMSDASSPTLILINDLDADGRDVSWLWDVDFEQLAGIDAPFATGGIRGADMAVRLKYAGIPASRIRPLGDVRAAFDAFVASVPAGSTAYILPTYTAMLELRALLAERGVVPAFWQQ